MTDYEKTWAQQAQMQQGGVNALNQFNTSAPISEIEIFKQVWPWIDGYSGMLMRKRGSVIDFPNSEVRKGSGSVLILTRNDEEIAVFQTWAGYHMIEGAP